MFSLYERIRDFLFHEMWRLNPDRLPPWRGRALRLVRLVFVLFRELLGGELTLHAMSLVYTTLLSLVPLLAVSFSVLKAFGVHNQIQPFLLQLLAPLGPKGIDFANQIVVFVENVNVRVLGFVGLGFLVYTVITLIQKIEYSFNFVWGIHRPRSISRRFSDYLSVILIGPVLVLSAVGITASILNNAVVQALLDIEPLGTLVVLVGQLLPFLFVIIAFTFIYIFVPNTSVNWRSALVGGVVGGILWQTIGLVFANFAAGTTRYDAIYSGFAIVILFMLWLYLSWLVLLFGAEVAYYHQHPQQIRMRGGRFRPSCRLREQAALTVMYLVADSHVHGEAPWTLDTLVQRLNLPGDALEDLIEGLVKKGLLVDAGTDTSLLVPARDPERITVQDVLQAIRSLEEEEYRAEGATLDIPEVEVALDRAEQGVRVALDGMDLRSLVVGHRNPTRR